MPKLKTKKGLAKRIKVTATGKFRHAKARKSHLLHNKDKAHRQFALGKELSTAQSHQVKQMMPYA